jgi:hypothetical protein
MRPLRNSGKLTVGLAVRKELAEIEHEVDHDRCQNEKEEGEDDPWPAKTTTRRGWLDVLGDRLAEGRDRRGDGVALGEREGVLGVELTTGVRRGG